LIAPTKRLLTAQKNHPEIENWLLPDGIPLAFMQMKGKITSISKLISIAEAVIVYVTTI